MPLLKLWNSLRGRSAHSVPKPPANDSGSAQAPAQATHKRRQKSTGFSLFGGGPHAGLRKQIRGVTASTVLEISVEDGQRAAAVMETLTESNPGVRYLAIDQFELSGGVTVKQFHRRLRASGIHPQLFPGTIEQGLTRVAHTVGAVDLLVIAASEQQWRTPEVLTRISRISHQHTVVVVREGDLWTRLKQPFNESRGIRRAA